MGANGPIGPFAEGMQRSAIGVNQYSTRTIETPGAADVDSDALSVNFTHGWFVMPELELGGRLGYGSTEVGTTDTTAYDIAAYGRWYFDTTSNMRPWAQASFGIGNAEVKSGGTTTDDDSTTFTLGGGITDMISDDVAVDLGLDYRATAWDTADTDDNGFFLTVALSIFYGG